MEVQAKNNSTQNDSPAGEFLQSDVWRSFQESVGRKTFNLSGKNFWANIVEHSLPIAGKYFYVPRGPIFNFQFSTLPTLPTGQAGGRQVFNQDQIYNDPVKTLRVNGASNEKLKNNFDELIRLAKENNAGWIRIEPETEEVLEAIKKNTKYKIEKAPHDMQPKEIFVIDITKSEKEILAEMKPKTRYNIRLAEKKGVGVFLCCHPELACLPVGRIQDLEMPDQVRHDRQFCIDEFIRLTAVMAKRQGITAHPKSYYQKMFENIPGDMLKLYVAEFEEKIIVANLVVFYGNTCTYLHGASDDEFRNVMAPYLLQWRQIQDAKKVGCVRYDFGGIKKMNSDDESENNKNTWSGITKFKTGFSPSTTPMVFLGSYDIVVNPKKYRLYRIIQRIKKLVKF